ncbi:hypothetical protein [Falsihalocynthiibacter arcticus]|uniref:Uncharacterized protein n=1 Tax=Falsihalocynthiibacter arcticus TaxID=1579316 RepID=A0A126V1U6_9RHOB|nr:hypothetical protein [Falsihalocynthiibacter arcticus]AML51925.1 hypothetical protein RC74_12195 [Falsihalocynthiibacter arcticus]
MKIDRMTIQMQGTKPQAQQFARHLQTELKRLNLPAQSGHLAHLSLPALTIRPGEGPQILARRTATALLAATKRQGQS